MDIVRTAKKRKGVFIMMRKEQELLFEKCRTYRRFLQKPLPEGLLSHLVGIAHKRSCGRNGQVLSFYAAASSKALAALLPHLHWAAALPKEIGTPQKGEEPVALIFLVRSKDASPLSLVDAGIAVDAMAYCAMCEGVGSAILAALDHAAIQEILGLKKDQEILLCLALGYPAHKSTVVPVPESGKLDYYVDEKRDYFVPKKDLSDVMTVL